MEIDKDLMVELFDEEQMTDVDGNTFTVKESIGKFSINWLESSKYLKECDRDILIRWIDADTAKIQRITDIQNTPVV